MLGLLFRFYCISNWHCMLMNYYRYVDAQGQGAEGGGGWVCDDLWAFSVIFVFYYLCDF